MLAPHISTSQSIPAPQELYQPFKNKTQLHPARAAFEFYPTPPEATRALLSVERFDGGIWECACGDGRIARELDAAGYDVVATDLADYGYGKSDTDFLAQRIPRAKNIVTNPPYGHGLADQFIRHALRFCAATGGTVAMLLNVNSLCHPDRHDSFIKKPPVRIWGLDDCVCYPNGDPKQATRFTLQHRYAWLIWTPHYQGPTTMGWLTTAPFKKPKLPTQHQQQGALNA